MGTFTRTYYCSMCKIDEDADGFESQDKQDVLDHIGEAHGQLIQDTGRDLATAISIRSEWTSDE